jgi:hypothetical protein
MVAMVGPLLVNLVVSVVMFLLVWDRATGERFYPATIPTIVQAALAALAAAAGLAVRRVRFACLIVSGAALGALGIAAFYAGTQWPGGDDGGGFGWFFLVCGGCAVSFVIALTTTLIGVAQRARERCTSDVRKQEPSAAVPSKSRKGAPKARRGLRWPWGLVAAAGLYLAWIVAGPISWTRTRTESHPGGIEIRSIDLHELGPLFPLPVYHHVDTDHERVLLVKGREVLRSNAYKDLHPSPTGAYVVAAHWLHNGPMRIYSTGNLRYVELSVDASREEFPGHYYGYPFGFLRWEDDSNFLVEVTGSSSEGVYGQVWRVDAATGARTRMNRDHCE